MTSGDKDARERRIKDDANFNRLKNVYFKPSLSEEWKEKKD